jgi:hypothetical protein
MLDQKLKYPKHLLIIFIILLLGRYAEAQTEGSKRITLGSHVFTPITYSPLPSSSTYFNMVTSYGQTINLFHYFPEYEFLEIIGLEGEVTFVDLHFSYQQRIRDWLAAYINLGLAARLGTEVQSILSQGFNTINSFELGWQIKLVEKDNFAIGATAELQNYNGNFINILGFVRDIKNDHPDPKISESIPVLTIGSGLRFAYGFNDLIGMSALTEFSYGETYLRGKNDLAFIAGAGLDLNFYPRYNVPLGLIINYNLTSQPEFVYVTGRSAHIWKIKIAYTKASDFSLGVEYSILKMPMPNVQKDPVAYSLALASRFYF